MTKLQGVRIIPSSTAQKRALIQWLHERRIDGLLREDDKKRFTQENHDFGTSLRKTTVLYSPTPVRMGQIRLFHPFVKETNQRPRYFAVLIKNRDGSWLAAPFSRFSVPAVPGEWKIGRKAPAVRILCIWNAKWLTGSLLEHSWVVDRLSPSKIDQAVVMYRLLAEDKELSQLPLDQIGPPLVHPLDPRVEYLEEEREWFSSLIVHYSKDKGINLSSTAMKDGVRSLPLAAEKRDQYGIAKDRAKKRNLGSRDPR